ncbi:hypothetical protein HW115_06375 [Verrucomicrobiaceae bacterium N1E253]|uniref:Uncharacterized protein n=1 Tax=Oceaniferula marina TaxID=2748318 RepID=A0A851GBW3_9BACT|nr:hypothetical protein [Oceaniferula marina]NWK55228.1 hypothetical protein [Oceaniferula marina]
MQAPVTPPTAYPVDPRVKDDEHLRLLAVFHYVYAGLTAAGLIFLVIHFLVMKSVMMTVQEVDVATTGSTPAGPSPTALMGVFVWFYLLFGLLMLAMTLANAYSGVCLRKKSRRTFSLVIAGVNCLNMPLGTVLGIFTIMVLVRDSVARAYQEREQR